MMTVVSYTKHDPEFPLYRSRKVVASEAKQLCTKT